ncbi:B-cell receptor-associated protein 31-like protein [Thalictrum thalictroides]|uniref:Endoplasmic reticulum transmembrane protein n=1 Tax=Thalictrum thalictroides TaxID=46969 RepID=A0A7J6W7V8_THATH|nr:B-cell receptor-associated protein 31-like protein [Thalictrum thalictroides]
MIQLLFLVLFAEGTVALFLMLKIGPLRELVMKGLDQLKTGKGPATVKTIACTMSVILLSSITSILKIQNKGVKLGTLTPMDQVLWRTHLLEASLMGYILFLVFVIDRVHEYLRKLIGLRSKVEDCEQEVGKLQKEKLLHKEKEDKSLKEIRSLKEEISNLTENLKKLQLESEEKDKRVLSAEAHVVALQKQSEDLLLEYDRLLDQTLQGQAVNYRG